MAVLRGPIGGRLAHQNRRNKVAARQRQKLYFGSCMWEVFKRKTFERMLSRRGFEPSNNEDQLYLLARRMDDYSWSKWCCRLQ